MGGIEFEAGEELVDFITKVESLEQVTKLAGLLMGTVARVDCFSCKVVFRV